MQFNEYTKLSNAQPSSKPRNLHSQICKANPTKIYANFVIYFNVSSMYI